VPRQRRDGAGRPGRDGGRRREAVGIIALFLLSGSSGVSAGRSLAQARRRRGEGLSSDGEQD